MADDDFEDEVEVEVEVEVEDDELDEEDLDEEALDETFDDDDDDVDVLVDEELEVEEVLDVAVPLETAVAAEDTTTTEEEEDDVVDLDEELHPDDVEEALDVVLRERTAAAGLEDEEDEEDEQDERGEGGTKIVPRRPGEFLCSSCFLVLPRHQLADEKRMLCRDCA
jgi:hypothetical protein